MYTTLDITKKTMYTFLIIKRLAVSVWVLAGGKPRHYSSLRNQQDLILSLYAFRNAVVAAFLNAREY